MRDVIEQLKELVRRVESWPQRAQEELLRSAFDIEMKYGRSYELSEADRAALERSADDVRNGRFATDEQIAQLFGRFRQK